MFRILPLLLFWLIAKTSSAQTIPGEGDVINYRLAGFSVPSETRAVRYIFEVRPYITGDDGAVFKDSITHQSDSNRTIIMLPSFDQQYAWRVTYIDKKGKNIKTTQSHHFRTGKYVTIDSSKYRLRIIDSATHHEDVFIIVDNISVIYDMNGNPIWYLPDVPLFKKKDMQLRCLKPTADGTFTAVSDLEAFELDYNGRIVWQAPNDGKVSGNAKESYHHEFTKLSNGHYMVAGFQSTMEKAPADYKLKPGMLQPGRIEQRNDGIYRQTKSDNLIEYDKYKNVVWSWKSIDHLDIGDFFRRSTKGVNIEMHMNAFYFDTNNNVIYISYRNSSEIIKIEYPSGKILHRYGHLSEDGNNGKLFYGQHNIIKGPDGQLYLFNNNASNHIRVDPSPHKISHVSVLQEQTNSSILKQTWDFPCDIDTNAEWYGTGGGSVALLPDGCILTGTGSASRTFIVSHGKKIIWNAVAQFFDGEKWLPVGPYRVNYITRNELEKFIFK